MSPNHCWARWCMLIHAHWRFVIHRPTQHLYKETKILFLFSSVLAPKPLYSTKFLSIQNLRVAFHLQVSGRHISTNLMKTRKSRNNKLCTFQLLLHSWTTDFLPAPGGGDCYQSYFCTIIKIMLNVKLMIFLTLWLPTLYKDRIFVISISSSFQNFGINQRT